MDRSWQTATALSVGALPLLFILLAVGMRNTQDISGLVTGKEERKETELLQIGDILMPLPKTKFILKIGDKEVSVPKDQYESCSINKTFSSKKNGCTL